MIGLNYIETDTMRMYINKEKKLERIWMPKAQGTLFPISQIPTDKITSAFFCVVRSSTTKIERGRI